MCSFAVHDLAWDLLHDSSASFDARRKSGLLYLAFALTGDCGVLDLDAIRPLLAQASGEESQAATQLLLVRMILRKQEWWRSLRPEVRSLLTSLCRTWLRRDLDLTVARSARCLHLSDEILSLMREAGAIRRRPSPFDDGTWLDSWGMEDDLLLNRLLPLESAATASAAGRPEDPAGESRRLRVEETIHPLIVEQLLKKLLSGEPSGEDGSLALACLWWTAVVSVEFEVEEIEAADDGITPLAARLMPASFVLGMSLGLGWNRLELPAVRRLIARPADPVEFTTIQLFLVRLLLRDLHWWKALRAEIRALLKELCLIWKDARCHPETGSRQACLRLCEQLIAHQYELYRAQGWSEYLPDEDSPDEAPADT